MIRYAFIMMAALGMAAAATAAVAPDTELRAPAVAPASHETIVEKNSPFPVIGPITVEECTEEDCSDLAS
ncbi:hypothetical protein [Aestuariivirga sp.]|uniref:hypothetical protein n=1 Tax=Aestuariivirga sp. TaxID=2650926 RepID=UPI00391A90CA